MPDFREDHIAYPIMVDMLECVKDQLAVSGLEELSFLSVLPGIDAIIDLRGADCSSTGFVQLSSMFPSSAFPEAESAPYRANQGWAFVLNVGIMRCGPMLDDDHNSPDPEEYLSLVREQMADMAALRRAICSCLNGAERDYVLSAYTPEGPQGGIVGGYWSVTVSGS